MQVDDRLLPATVEEQPGDVQHQYLGQRQQAPRHRCRDATGKDVDVDVAIFMKHQLGAGEDQPDERQPGNFLAEEQARIEAIAQHHVGEDQAGDADKADHHQRLERNEVAIDKCFHGVSWTVIAQGRPECL